MSSPMPPGGEPVHLGDRLSALLDGELAEPDVGVARRHLAACPTCTAELRDVGQARSWLRHLPPVAPPAGFLEQLLGGDRPPVAASGRTVVVPLRRRRAAVAVLAGCAAAAAAVLGLLPAPESPAQPPVGRLVEAHATSGVGGDPVTQLVPVGIPVSFGR